MEGGDGSDVSAVFFCVRLDQNSPAGERRITWGGADAQAACEVIFESSEHGRHVRLHLVQVDDVPHQSGVDAHLGQLALYLGWGGSGGRVKPLWEQKRRKASRSSLTFGLLGGVEPDVGGAGEGGGPLEPGGHSGGSSDLSHQQGAQQVQPTESHHRPEGGRNVFFFFF